MLNKKSAFKPKAAIRRPAPGSAPQSSQRASVAERSSKAPTQEGPSPSSNSQRAPHPTPSAASDPRIPASGSGTPEDFEAKTQVLEKLTEPGATEPTSQATADSISVVRVAQLQDEKATTAAPRRPAPEDETTTPARSDEISLEGPSPAEAPGPSPTSAAGKRVGHAPGPDLQPARATAAPQAPPSLTESSASSPGTSPPNEPSGAAPLGDGHALSVQSTATISAESAVGEPPRPHTTAAFEPPSGPSTAAQPKRRQKRRAAVTSVEVSGETSATAPPKKRLRKRSVALPGEEDHQGDPAAHARATRGRKRSRSATENGEADESSQENTAQSRRRSSRPQRETTPPDAENVEIDVTQVKMADLAKDLHVGKKFSLHDELMERERAKRLRYNERRRRQQSGENGDAATENGEALGEGATPPSKAENDVAKASPGEGAGTTDAETSSSTPRAPIGEQYQIIDGEIVLDHRSLQVDRHARAREEAGELVEVEENDFTHHTTSATYLRRNLKPQQWTDEETDLFYQGLQAFGTDFDTICRMFRGKTRKHVKLKFNREERIAPERVNAALVGQKTVAIDMEQYQRATGRSYEPAEAIYAEQRRAEEEFEARHRALEEERAEEARRRRDEVRALLHNAIHGENSAFGGGDKAGKKGGRRGGKKQKAADVVGL